MANVRNTFVMWWTALMPPPLIRSVGHGVTDWTDERVPRAVPDPTLPELGSGQRCSQRTTLCPPNPCPCGPRSPAVPPSSPGPLRLPPSSRPFRRPPPQPRPSHPTSPTAVVTAPVVRLAATKPAAITLNPAGDHGSRRPCSRARLGDAEGPRQGRRRPTATARRGPNAFDCSGLVNWAYKSSGKSLPRSSSAHVARRHAGVEVGAAAR